MRIAQILFADDADVNIQFIRIIGNLYPHHQHWIISIISIIL